MQQIEPNGADNPFSLSSIHGMNSIGDHQLAANLNTNDDELMNASEDYMRKDNFDSRNDDLSSISSVSDSD